MTIGRAACRSGRTPPGESIAAAGVQPAVVLGRPVWCHPFCVVGRLFVAVGEALALGVPMVANTGSIYVWEEFEMLSCEEGLPVLPLS